ncbi:hypothetical protein [Secundilactobacillus mixtipabuli]|uniref:Uncharacterized protein n=1 Tax=Secundilactobacillus mixtipabuli TaxID=1435342 RepID=A0A1Z5ICU8_9LACO|nr:hypothetical protein [Secundilactobacillus mixtipabuli]GAW99579.1 hypothetical protein IWT30_01549 [Secundilactobacillus mixtipabuli]
MTEAIMLLLWIVLATGAFLVVGSLYGYRHNLSKPNAIFYTALAFYLGLFVVTFLSIANAIIEIAFSTLFQI